MFAKPRHLTIDIGSRNVKLVELIKQGSSYKLLRARSVPIYYEPQSGYIPQYDEALKQAVITILPRASRGTLSLTISGQSVFLRFVRIPKTSHGRIDQIIHYEAEQQVPFPLNEVVWDYQIIRQSEAGEDVVLVAVKKELISSLLSSLAGESITINLIDSAPLALYNALGLAGDFGNQVVLDIGARTTNLLIPDQDNLWARTIMVAGDDITKAIANAANISFQEAEDIKIKYGMDPAAVPPQVLPEGVNLTGVIGEVLTDLLTEISSSVGYYKSQLGQKKDFDGILLTGGSANLKNIANFIEDNLGIPIKAMDLFSKIEPATHLRLDEQDGSIYGAVLGSALRQLEPVSLKMNLLPDEQITEIAVRGRRPYLVTTAFFLILALLGLNGIAFQAARSHRQNIAALDALIDNFHAYQIKTEAIKKQIDGMRQKLDLLNEMASAKSFWLRILLELSRLVGEDVWLVGFNKDAGEGLVISGETDASFTRITELKDKLEASDYFEQVIIESADVVELPLKSFQIRMRVTKEALE